MKQTELVKLKEMLAKLTYGQRQELMKSWASGDDYERCVEILETQQNERVCPHCGSDHLVRNGSASDLQRYKCRGCDRTFNMLTGTSLARLRQKSKWLAQADVLREGISIRQAQKRLFVARSTAFRWRHRFLSAQKTVQAQALVGIAEADETFFLHSRKGQHGLDRTPRRRGGESSLACITSRTSTRMTAVSRTGFADSRAWQPSISIATWVGSGRLIALAPPA